MTATGDKISHLNISDVQTNDGGLYQCEAVSKVGTASHSARLNVHGLPHIRPMEKKMIVAGGTLFVTCPFAGYPIESVTWERGTRMSDEISYCPVTDIVIECMSSLSQIRGLYPSIGSRRSFQMER